jgi:hypothetical protein
VKYRCGVAEIWSGFFSCGLPLTRMEGCGLFLFVPRIQLQGSIVERSSLSVLFAMSGPFCTTRLFYIGLSMRWTYFAIQELGTPLNPGSDSLVVRFRRKPVCFLGSKIGGKTLNIYIINKYNLYIWSEIYVDIFYEYI